MNNLKAFDFDDQDVGLLADNHLFGSGPDLFGQERYINNFETSSHTNNEADTMVNSLPQESHNFQPTNDQFFAGSLDLLQDFDFSGNQTNSAQPSLAFPSPDDSLGLSSNTTLPGVPSVPLPIDTPAQEFEKSSSHVHNTPISSSDIQGLWSTINMNGMHQAAGGSELQQWHALPNQQMQLYQPGRTAVQRQSLQSTHRAVPAQTQPAFNEQSVFQMPSFQQSLRTAQSSPNLQSLQYTQQVRESAQVQDMDFIEQLQALQNAKYADITSMASLGPQRQNSHSVTLPMSTQSGEKVSADVSRPLIRHIRKSARHARLQTLKADTPGAGPQITYKDLVFDSLLDAEEAMSTRNINSDWEAPEIDNTMPNTDRKRAEYVAMVYNALQDTSECKDNKDGFSFQKRWLKPGYYNVEEMEKVCWYIVDVAERLHVEGPSAMNIYCQDALKKLKASRELTFEQRIMATCAMLKLSKHLCDNLMKGEGIEALVGAPKQKMSGAKTMMIQNKKRQKWLESGRKYDPDHVPSKEHDAAGLEEHELTDASDNDVEPTHDIKSGRTASGAKPRTKTNPRPRTFSDDGSNDSDDSTELLRRQSVFDDTSADEFDAEDISVEDSDTGSADGSQPSVSRKSKSGVYTALQPQEPDQLSAEPMLSTRTLRSHDRMSHALRYQAADQVDTVRKPALESNAAPFASKHDRSTSKTYAQSRTKSQTHKRAIVYAEFDEDDEQAPPRPKRQRNAPAALYPTAFSATTTDRMLNNLSNSETGDEESPDEAAIPVKDAKFGNKKSLRNRYAKPGTSFETGSGKKIKNAMSMHDVEDRFHRREVTPAEPGKRTTRAARRNAASSSSRHIIGSY